MNFEDTNDVLAHAVEGIRAFLVKREKSHQARVSQYPFSAR